jgi:hypothetical protein
LPSLPSVSMSVTLPSPPSISFDVSGF